MLYFLHYNIHAACPLPSSGSPTFAWVFDNLCEQLTRFPPELFYKTLRASFKPHGMHISKHYRNKATVHFFVLPRTWSITYKNPGYVNGQLFMRTQDRVNYL